MTKSQYNKRRLQVFKHPEHDGAVELALILIADVLAETLWDGIAEEDEE